MMSSVKRRRSISIDLTIVRILKDEAIRLKHGSHTGLVSKMFLGEVESLASRIIDPVMIGKSKSVSMKESVWLSIKARAENDGVGTSKAGLLIIMGKSPPLTSDEIALGEKLAKEREEARRSEPGIQKKRKSSSKPVEKLAVESPQKKPEKIKETVHQNTFLDETEEEEKIRKKRISSLSKGVPIEDADIAPDAAFKDLNSSEEEYLGGVWSL